MNKQSGEFEVFSLIVVVVLVLGLIVGGAMWILPNYSVWQQKLAGQAELERASQNRQIAVQEAEAKLAAAKLLAEAEAERAKGIAAANKIIADGLGGHEGYLRWLWIDAMAHNPHGATTIYIPTEAGLPLLEAGRR